MTGTLSAESNRRSDTDRRGRPGRGRLLDFCLQAVLFGVALSFALTHPWTHAYVGEAQFGDAAYWDLGGESWARGYIAEKTPDIRAGYSLFLGLVYSIAGVDFRHAFAAQALLFGLTTVLISRIGQRLGGRVPGLIAGLSIALNPYLAEWVAVSATESLGSFCNLAALYFLIQAVRFPQRWALAAWFGGLLGFANTVRPLSLLFVIPAALALLVLVKASWNKRVALTLGAAVALGSALAPGVGFQYWRTKETGLSSNTAANFYGASDPKYRSWTGGMYTDVAGRLKDRGIPATPANMNREFWGLTVQNYLNHPVFQIKRIADGMAKYATFEGQRDRPERYTFFRPYVLAGGLVFAAIVFSLKRWLIPAMLALAACMGFLIFPMLFLGSSRIAGVLAGLWALRRRGASQTAWGLISIYWILIGFSQALVGGTEGFLLHRLYTQVEPVSTLLTVLGAFQILRVGVAGNWRRLRVLHIVSLARRLGPLPLPLSKLGPLTAAVAVLILCGGLSRMLFANVFPQPHPPFQLPAPEQLEALLSRTGLSGQYRQVWSSRDFAEMQASLGQKMAPESQVVYVLPGQFSRFLWHIEDQQRTLFWFFFADRPRPPALDRHLLWAEAAARLAVTELRDRYGVLVLSPSNEFFSGSGEIRLLNFTSVRAFIPWDDSSNRFVLGKLILFPWGVSLVDSSRVAAATLQGQVAQAGLVRMTPGGANLRCLKFVPDRAVSGGPWKEASIGFSNLKILPASQFKSLISLHPRLYGSLNNSAVIAELWIRVEGKEKLVAERLLRGRESVVEANYQSFEADLGAYSGQTVQLRIRVKGCGDNPDQDEVFVGEPRVLAY